MKTYNQFCGVAKALDVVGERWTLLLVRDLLLGARRYTDLLEGLPGLTTNLLARRLQHLQAAGLVEKAPDGAYALTAAGRGLEPVVLALGRFGSQYLLQPGPGEQTDVRWAMVSLKRRYQRSRWARTLVLVVDEDAFTLRLGGEALEVVAGHHALAPDAVLQGAATVWLPLLGGRSSLDAALSGGGLRLSGDRGTAEDFAASVGIPIQ